MITLTGTTREGPRTAHLDLCIDAGFDAAVLRGLDFFQGDLVFALGSIKAYSSRPSDDALHAASVFATRYLRLAMAKHGPMLVPVRRQENRPEIAAKLGAVTGYLTFTDIQEVQIDSDTAKKTLKERLLQAEQDEHEDERN